MMWIAAGLAVYALDRACWAMDEAHRRDSDGLGLLTVFLFGFAVVALILSYSAWKTLNGGL